MFGVKIAVSVLRMGWIGEIAIKVLCFVTELVLIEMFDWLKSDIFESNRLNLNPLILKVVMGIFRSSGFWG